MKYKLLITIVLSFIIFSVNVQATEIAELNKEKKWTKIIVKENRFSFAMPSDFLVDPKRNKPVVGSNRGEAMFYKKRLFWQIGFENGTRFEVKKYSHSRVKNLFHVKVREAGKESVGAFAELDNYLILIFKPKPTEGDHISQKFFVGVNKTSYYEFSISANSFTNPEVTKFLLAVKINGKSIFHSKPKDKNKKASEEINFPEKDTISISKLKRSERIEKALDAKSRNIKINYPARPLSELPPLKKEAYSRSAIILKPTERPLRINDPKYVILRVKLLANNEVGEVDIYSNADKGMIERSIKIIEEMKFIPAEIKGKPVDSFYDFKYSFPKIWL